MLNFEKKQPLDILTCNNCQSTGFVGFKKCKECKGKAMGCYARGKFLYWGLPLTRYHLKLYKARKVLNKIRRITGMVLGFTFLFWLILFLYQGDLYIYLIKFFTGDPSYLQLFFVELTTSMKALFYLALLSFLYVYYRGVRDKELQGLVESFDYAGEGGGDKKSFVSWKEINKLSKRKKFDIATSFTVENKKILASAYELADKHRHKSITPVHIFFALLYSKKISSIFIRLGIATNQVRVLLQKILDSYEQMDIGNKMVMPLVSTDVEQALFASYEGAYEAHQDYVGVAELLINCVAYSASLKELLFDLGIDQQKLKNVVEWVRIKETLYRRYKNFVKRANKRSKKGMDKAMTAVSTPYLNNFSQDLTLLAQSGRLDSCIARDDTFEEMFRVVESGGNNILLVGDYGVGKKSIIEGVAQKMVEEDVPKKLYDKRLVQLSVSSLLAGTDPFGAVERLQRIMYEVGRAGNVVLFIHNIDDIIGVSAGGKDSLDVAESLVEFLGRNRAFVFATISNEGFGKYIANSSLGGIFTKIEISEMAENQAIQVLEGKVGSAEFKNKVYFSYGAIESIVKFATKFMHDNYLPGSALEIMTEVATYTKTQKGQNSLVTAEEVAQVVSQKTKIPVSAVSANESEKLMRLEEEMHKRVIGQDEAVGAVANALRRARAEIRSTKKPIANFLFLGPTGVGKTELAKTIADIYFGGEDKITRIDMSEYQDNTSVYRLIGNAGEKGTGILTEAVRRNPFTIVLLDEIEKADPNVLNLFLQVMDDGRLTDSSGRKVDFTNVILIATSNAGTSYVQEQFKKGLSVEVVREKLMHGELSQYFAPEFLNRFDGIVLFNSLTQSNIKKIAGLMLKRIAKDLEKRGIELEVQDEALEFLSQVGYDPDFGARPMRRAIQERIENQLAELLLSNKLKRRDVVVLGKEGSLIVKR